jgi:hypothetical protein
MILSNRKRKPFFSILLIWFAFTLMFSSGKGWLRKINADANILIYGNTILLLATLLSFFLYRRALKNDQPHKFLKYIYGGMFLKMLICLIAAFIYISTFQSEVNKPAIFGCMILYFVYTFVEVSILLRLSKEKKNAETGSPS